MSFETDYCANCGTEHGYMGGPCDICDGKVFTSDRLECMKGRIFNKVEKIGGAERSRDVLQFVSDGLTFEFYHRQDCCEDVRIEDICGDLSDLCDTPLLVAEEVTQSNTEDTRGLSSSWTFYKFATVKGSVTVRWLGESNGCYSERVDFQIMQNKRETND